MFCPLPLLLAAGSIRWAGGWAFAAAFVGGVLAITLMLSRRDPVLLQERMKGAVQTDQPAWDKIIVVVALVIWIAWLVLIGLDARFRWSSMPIWVRWIGASGVAAAWIGCYRAFYENTFLLPVVRVQSERRHHVVSTGLYGFVRHPMYAAVVLFFVAAPLALGSWWALLGSGVLAVLVAVRAVLEERLLRRDLAGYEDYAARVKYRLLPLVW